MANYLFAGKSWDKGFFIRKSALHTTVVEAFGQLVPYYLHT